MRNNKQLRGLGIAFVALVLVFGLMTATAQERSEITLVEKVIATALYPFQVSTDWVAGRFRAIGVSVQELGSLREENSRLREQVQALAQHEAANQMLEWENTSLRIELLMKERSPAPLLSAEVISRTSDNWYRTVLINRGSRDGVQQNMAVTNWQGLVGKVSHTTPYTATVQLVLDAGFGKGGFGAGARLPTGELGIIDTVQGGNVRLRFFTSDPDVKLGLPVFTSGQAILPGDLLIGYVESFGSPDSAFEKFVNIRPSVDFDKLNLVHVVLFTTDKDRGANAP